MIRSHAVEIIVRRLNLNAGRVAALSQRVAEAGLLPKANGRDIPDLGALELARLFLAAVVDRGLGSAAKSVTEFSALQTEQGVVLLDVLEGLIAGRIAATGIRQAIFQIQPACAVLIGESHLRFGAEPSTDGAARHVIVPGYTLAAIVLEFQNLTPQQADDAIVVGRLDAALI
jgi:hypothetical protein